MLTLKIQPPNSTSKNTHNIAQPSRPKTQLVTQNDYARFDDQRDHVYNIPDTYIGGSVKGEREERVLDLNSLTFIKATIEVPQGVERIYMEILSNAGDNAARSMFKGVDPGEITVTMTSTTVKVRNGGIPIPVEQHKSWGVYVPEAIFGNLMSSSSYDQKKKRQFSSRNGFGAKLTNIFSKRFRLTVADPFNEKLYVQEWRDNMKKVGQPKVTEYSSTQKAYVEIEYEMDFERFGYTEGCYPEEAYQLFARHAVDSAFTLKIPVSFNGKRFQIKSGKDYAKLCLGKESVKNSVLFYTWPEGTETYTKKGVEYAKEKGVLPVLEICAVDTPDSAERRAFVNNIYTQNGGVHYEAAFKSVANSILELINGSKKDKKRKKEPRQIKLTLADVKKHVSLFVNCWLEDPIFDSQSKNELKSPTPKFSIPEEVLRPINKWELVARLYAELDAKMFRNAAKSDGKKKRTLHGMDKLYDANKAASTESVNCTLCVTEGDSALTFARKLYSHLPNNAGQDYMGFFPLRGKPLNVMNAAHDQIANNAEIHNLKKVLGLREGIDYTDEENYKTLRYGHLMVCADSDNDGLHILGLVYNLFYCKFPSLLARGYVKYLKTKILDVTKGTGKNKKFHKFYSQHEYEEWKAQTPDYQTWTHNYYKGLGSNEKEDIEDEAQEPNVVMTVLDQEAPRAFHLAFDKALTDSRKAWIKNWTPDYTVETLKIKPLSGFINHEFIQFSIADVARSIPRFTDGLKTSQRKILWTALKTWAKKSDKIKVAQFAAAVSKKTCYMHGEKSLEGAIVGMAQNFVGSNNLPYFERKGEFGTRSKLGGDASAGRYIHTRPEFWLNTVFRKEDFPILDILIDEGEQIEPRTLLPILPMHLINGQIGIGTGSSTWIPAHDPLQIVYWLECRLQNLPVPELTPWYRGFTGEIEIRVREPSKKTNQSESQSHETNSDYENSESEGEGVEDPDEVMVDKKTKISLVTKGIFEESGRNKVLVTELPIGRSIHSYKVFLDKMRETKQISNYKNYSTPEIPKFEITGAKTSTLIGLKLVKTYGMSNMVLLDDQDRPNKYRNAEEIMETFYHIRLGYYQKRKEYLIGNMEKEISQMNQRIKFILAVIKGYQLNETTTELTVEQANSQGGILVVGKNKAAITEQAKALELNVDLVKKVTLYQCTQEEVTNLREQIARFQERLDAQRNQNCQSMWLNDLEDFTKIYCKHYREKYVRPSP